MERQRAERQGRSRQSGPVQRTVAALRAGQGTRSPQSAALQAVGPAAAAQRHTIETIRAGVLRSPMQPVSTMLHGAPRMVAQRRLASRIEAGTASLDIAHTSASIPAGSVAQRNPAQRQDDPADDRSASPAGGLPAVLRSGIEALSGIAMDDVQVHYNSPQPAQIGALAYAQGSDIHLGPGQEEHLPHEAWHVVQQAQGRVRPTMQMRQGVDVNDDAGLEREADVMGARALQRVSDPESEEEEPLPAQMKTDSGAPIVQRRVGFEFEVGSIRTTQWNGGYVQGQYDPMPKGGVLATGAGYEVQADEDGGGSDLEFVTDAFPVTVGGFAQLTQAVNEIADIALYIERHSNKRMSSWWLPHATSVARRYVEYNGGDPSGTPQATVGLTLSGLDALFGDIATQPGVAAPATAAQELFGGGLAAGMTGASGQGTAAATGIPMVGDARGAAIAEIGNLPGPMQTPELQALVTQLCLYIVTGRRGVSGYGKTIAVPFMMRTDFGTVFNELPAVAHLHFQANPGAFVTLVCDAARHLEAGIADNGDVFEGGIYQHAMYDPGAANAKTPAERQMLTGNLTRAAWLTAIAGGNDLLTRNTFPAATAPQQAEIESLGSMGGQMDPLGPAPPSLPILEFRGMPKILPGLFPLMAMDIFRYVFALNTAAGGGNPGQLQAIGMNDRIDMAINNPAPGWLAGPGAWGQARAEQAANRQARQQAIAAAQLLVTAWGLASGGD